jgi:hypothetical protein
MKYMPFVIWVLGWYWLNKDKDFSKKLFQAVGYAVIWISIGYLLFTKV